MIFFLQKESGEKRVGFQDDDDHNEDEENDKRPVSKLHRRDTPHHLKNKRVQQHLNDKAANVILNKLKEKPHIISTVEEVQGIEMLENADMIQNLDMNSMPIGQDVGLPMVPEITDVNQNGIEISSNGEFFDATNTCENNHCSIFFYSQNICYLRVINDKVVCGYTFNNCEGR